MAKKIEIIGQSLVITDTVTSQVLFEAPKSQYYYKAKLLSQGYIKIYNLDVKDATVNMSNIALSDAVDSTDTPFNEASFRTFARENLGFKVSNGGGSTAVPITQNAQNYSALTAGEAVNDIAYVRESQGTAWLPFTLGGTYYPKGFYVWDGAAWVSDRNAIASALETALADDTAIYNGSVSTSVDIDLSTTDSAHLILQTNSAITVSNTPSVGSSKVLTLRVSSVGNSTLSLPVGWDVVGEYDNTGVDNLINVEFANYPTSGLKVAAIITVR